MMSVSNWVLAGFVADTASFVFAAGVSTYFLAKYARRKTRSYADRWSK